jgi:hypothetical protein
VLVERRDDQQRNDGCEGTPDHAGKMTSGY